MSAAIPIDDAKLLVDFRQAQKLAKDRNDVATATTGTSITAAFARSFVLLLGVYFKRPSRLFRPSRVDTLATLRQMALSANQSLSPAFIRALVKDKGPRAILQSILPPLLINTALGTLLFTSHSYFCYLLSRLQYFAPKAISTPDLESLSDPENSSYLDQWTTLTKRGETLTSIPIQQPRTGSGDEDETGPEWLSFGAEDQISFMESIHRLPHPTILNALAGASAGALQGLVFAPIENTVRLLQRGITSWSEAFSRVFGFKFSTARFRPIKDLGLPSSSQEVKQFLGFGQGVRKAWKGVRWGIARDMLGFGMFFSAFDVSRRLGLGVKAMLTPEKTMILMDSDAGNLGKGQMVDDFGLHPVAPTKARLAQAACLVAGGITASFLAEFVTRPIRKLEDLAKIKENRAPGLEFKAKPTHIRGAIRPFQSSILPLVRRTVHDEGLKGFFRNPAALHTPLSDRAFVNRIPLRGLQRVKMRLTKLGWRLVGVGPWGFGFLIFAYVGGEV